MVVVLAYQIFTVIRTEEEDLASFPPNPRSKPEIDQLDPAPPGTPPDIPPNRSRIDPRTFDNDPFVWRDERGAVGGDEDIASSLRLLRFQQIGNKYRVQIDTGTSRARWYEVGEAFESYELVSVNPDEKSVEVFDEGANKTRVLYLEE
jgi:hypothetical protein